MTILQSGNIIGKDPPRINMHVNAEVKHKIVYDLEQSQG